MSVNIWTNSCWKGEESTAAWRSWMWFFTNKFFHSSCRLRGIFSVHPGKNWMLLWNNMSVQWVTVILQLKNIYYESVAWLAVNSCISILWWSKRKKNKRIKLIKENLYNQRDSVIIANVVISSCCWLQVLFHLFNLFFHHCWNFLLLSLLNLTSGPAVGVFGSTYPNI